MTTKEKNQIDFWHIVTIRSFYRNKRLEFTGQDEAEENICNKNSGKKFPRVASPF
tara:strand:- start:15835 stop:15999 length:165 start_codon:yes stop_codon:yes gene_type:complete